MDAALLDVEREDGDLVVAFSPPEAAVVVSTTADEVGSVVVDHDRTGAARITGLDPAVRHFVHLVVDDTVVAVAGERRVAVEGSLNLRDLGGYPTADGRRVRWGRLYRSDQLGDLDDAGAAQLQALGLKTIIDFRGEKERERSPTPPLPGVESLHLPMAGRSGDQKGATDLVLSGELSEVDDGFMAFLYQGMLTAFPDHFGELVRRAASPEHEPVLFHCAAGKDRTGVAAALVLSALGVPDEDIVADYALTDRYRTEHRIEQIRPIVEEYGIPVDKVAALFSAPAAVMVATLDHLHEVHGGPMGYLQGEAGVDDATIERLRQNILV
jgi:protein-tyrosine phosphatase